MFALVIHVCRCPAVTCHRQTRNREFARLRVCLTSRPAQISSLPMGNAPDAVKRLVDLSACNAQADRFDQDRKVFLSPDYKEEQLRILVWRVL